MVVQVGSDEAANGAIWKCITIITNQHRSCTSPSSKAPHHSERPSTDVLTLGGLAVIVDAGMPFLRATCTYNLEGDGPLALKCYEEISSLNAAVAQAYYPMYKL